MDGPALALAAGAKRVGGKNLSELLCDLAGDEPFCPLYPETIAICAHLTRA